MVKKVWTPEDTARMDEAAKEAEKELREMLSSNPRLITVGSLGMLVCDWHRKWTSAAGHKRLGRIMNSISKDGAQMRILKITGKAKQVFDSIALLAKDKGNMTLEETAMGKEE